MLPKFGFAFLLLPGIDEHYAILQAQSIRQYAGSQKSTPIFAMLPTYCGTEMQPLWNQSLQLQTISDLESTTEIQTLGHKHWKYISPEGKARLTDLQVEIVPFDYTPSLVNISYTAKTFAAGAAEAYALGKVEQLIFSDTNMIFLNDPSLMALPTGRKIGLRPVDIQNIGLQWDEPVDAFWTQIYQLFRIYPEQLFPVISTVTRVKLKTWLNCSLMTVFPGNGLLQKWGAALVKYRDLPIWNKFISQSELYQIFLHQAFFNAVLLSDLTEEEIEIYPVQVNFPLHFYPEHPQKPAFINELISARFEFDGRDECWKTWLPMREPLKSWLINNCTLCIKK